MIEWGNLFIGIQLIKSGDFEFFYISFIFQEIWFSCVSFYIDYVFPEISEKK